MRKLLLAAGLISTTFNGVAIGEVGGAAFAQNRPLITIAKYDESDDRKPPRSDERSSKRERDGEKDGDHRGSQRCSSQEMAPFALAGWLSSVELFVGIRAEQLNAWRDYTSAMLNLTSALRPSEKDSSEGRKEGEHFEAPFARDERLADLFSAQATAAARLKASITVLRKVLTDEQLGRLAKIEMLH